MTKLLPFDLEAAKAGAKVVTRDGRPARIVCFDLANRHDHIAAALDCGEFESVWMFTPEGRASVGRDADTLFMAPTPVKRWRVIYRDDDNAAQRDFETLREANDFCEYNSNTAAPYEVEVTP